MCYILIMAQLHFYIPRELEERVRERAKARGISVSRYLAQIVRRHVECGWPEDFFQDVVGGWKGRPLKRVEQGKLEVREEL
jgi:hypothetical protein